MLVGCLIEARYFAVAGGQVESAAQPYPNVGTIVLQAKGAECCVGSDQ